MSDKYDQLKKNLKHLSATYSPGILTSTHDSARVAITDLQEEIKSLKAMTENHCFACEMEDALNEIRGTQSHPINCIWRLKEEYKIMEKELKKDRKFLFWSESENKPKIAQMEIERLSHE